MAKNRKRSSAKKALKKTPRNELVMKMWQEHPRSLQVPNRRAKRSKEMGRKPISKEDLD